MSNKAPPTRSQPAGTQEASSTVARGKMQRLLQVLLRLPVGAMVAAVGWLGGFHLAKHLQDYVVTIPLLLGMALAIGWGLRRWTSVPGPWWGAVIAALAGGGALENSHIAASYETAPVQIDRQWRGPLPAAGYVRLGAGMEELDAVFGSWTEFHQGTTSRHLPSSSRRRSRCKALYFGKVADGTPVWALDTSGKASFGPRFDDRIMEVVERASDLPPECQNALSNRKADDRTSPNEALLRVATLTSFSTDLSDKSVRMALFGAVAMMGLVWMVGQLWWLRHEKER